jgi:hypothetical protein
MDPVTHGTEIRDAQSGTSGEGLANLSSGTRRGLPRSGHGQGQIEGGE